MTEELGRLLRKWAQEDEDSPVSVIHPTTISYLGAKIFDDYEPSQFERFTTRLDDWLHNVSADEDRRTLFKLLDRLFFIGRADFESLCRAAYNGPILRWFVDRLQIDITNPSATSKLKRATRKSWFCPITDSMRINAFLKANNLTSMSHRPDWRSLSEFADAAKIADYVRSKSISQIVLLEDFIGSGTQIESVIPYASSVLPEIQFLVVSLVSCPEGHNAGRALASARSNITFESVLVVPREFLVKADPQPSEHETHILVRALTARVRNRLNRQPSDPLSQRYHGYKGIGAVVCMYSNCPNNTLPILHNNNAQWNALFPRIARR